MHDMGHDIMMRTCPTYRMQQTMPRLGENLAGAMGRVSRTYDPPMLSKIFVVVAGKIRRIR